MCESSDANNDLTVESTLPEKVAIEPLLEAMPQALVVVKNSVEFTYANSKFLKLIGCISSTQLKELDLFNIFCFQSEIETLTDTKVPTTKSIWLKHLSGERELVVAHLSIKGFLGIENLQLLSVFPLNQEGLGAYFIESITNDGAWVWDIENATTWRSARWLEMCGLTDEPALLDSINVTNKFEFVNASGVRDSQPPESADIETLLEGEGFLRDLEGPRKHVSWLGRVIEFDNNNKPLKVMGSLRDMTTFLKRNEPIVQARELVTHHARLLQLGESLATVSHELNQPLSAIASYASVCKGMLHGDSEINDLINLIEVQALRAGALLRRIKSYSRRKANERIPNSIIFLVNEVIEWMRTDPKCHDIDLTFSIDHLLDEENLYVMCDRIEIEQILINLIVNASTAIQFEKRRNLRRIEIILKRSSQVSSIDLVVADRGPGLPESIRETAFDPFVSGKKNSLGLGLSISRTIATELGGTLNYVPRPEGGSMFILSLPQYVVTR